MRVRDFGVLCERVAVSVCACLVNLCTIVCFWCLTRLVRVYVADVVVVSASRVRGRTSTAAQ